MKVLVGCNVLTQIDSAAYLSHCQMWFRMGRQFNKDDKFIYYCPRRTSIDNMRNFAVKLALEQECDYLFFIDDDMMLHEDTFKSLYEANKDVVMAHTFIRGYPYPPMCFKDPNPDPKAILTSLPHFKEYKNYIDENGLFEVDAIGCACVLIKCDLLKKIDPPHFVTLPNMTEDVFFCMRVKNTLGRDKVSIFVDTKVPTEHLLEKEVICERTRDILIERFEKEYGKSATNIESGDRGDTYLRYVEESLKETQGDPLEQKVLL